MTEGDTGCGVPSEVAQQDGLASQPHARLVQPGGRHRRRPVPASLSIWDRLASLSIWDRLESLAIRFRIASHPYLILTACLAGSLVSAGLAAADIADYPNEVGYLAILGVITGAAGGFTAVRVSAEKLRGWAYPITVVTMGLALISVAILVLLFMGQYGSTGCGGC
jgi:hypothetical protein